MKLALKFAVSMIILMFIVLAIDGYLAVRRDTELYHDEMKHNARVYGSILGSTFADLWRNQGRTAAMRLLQSADRGDPLLNIEWLEPDATAVADPQQPAQPSAVGRLQHTGIQTRRFEDQTYVYTHIPVTVNDQVQGTIVVRESRSKTRRFARTTAGRQIMLTSALVVSTTLATLLMGLRLVGRPIRALVAAVRQVGGGDLSTRINLRGRDELTELAHEFNNMCARLRESQDQLIAASAARLAALEQLRHADRLATVGKLAAGIAHELGTPLNVVSGRAQMISAGDLSTTQIQECAQIIRGQTDRISKIIRQLLDFARQSKPEKTSVDLAALCRQVLDVLAPIAHKHHATLHLNVHHPARVIASGEQIQQVITNLIINGIQAMPEGGMVEVTVQRQHTTPPSHHGGPPAEYCRICVRDDGQGIPSENFDRILDPFFTTKQIGKGTGLGLSIVYGIVGEHGGWLEIHSEAGRGSRFVVYLPLEAQL